MMKKYSYILLLPTLLLSMASCGKDDIEVIEQDTSWTMDPKYEKEDIRNKVGDVPTKTLVYFEDNEESFSGTLIDGRYQFEKFDFELGVNIAKKLVEDLLVSVVVDEDYTVAKGYEILPSEAYEIEKAVIAIGNTTGKANLKLNDTFQYKTNVDYVLPLKLVLENESGDLAVAKTRGRFVISFRVYPKVENLALEKAGAFEEKELFNSSVVFTSNVNEDKMKGMNDGVLASSYFNKGITWSPVAQSDFITAFMGGDELLEGIKIHTTYNRIKNIRVLSSMDGENYEIQGYVVVNENSNIVMLKFKEPLATQYVKLDMLNTNTEICEILFVK